MTIRIPFDVLAVLLTSLTDNKEIFIKPGLDKKTLYMSDRSFSMMAECCVFSTRQSEVISVTKGWKSAIVSFLEGGYMFNKFKEEYKYFFDGSVEMSGPFLLK